ncbi:hypothetical protein D9M70_589560 [compost metagenome]
MLRLQPVRYSMARTANDDVLPSGSGPRPEVTSIDRFDSLQDLDGARRQRNQMRPITGGSSCISPALPMNQPHGAGLQIVVSPNGLTDVEDALPTCSNDELEQQCHDRPDALGALDGFPELA